jgi:hypothetical protein
MALGERGMRCGAKPRPVALTRIGGSGRLRDLRLNSLVLKNAQTGNPASSQRSPGGVRPLHIDQIALPSQFGHWALRSEGAWGNPRSPFPVTQPRLAQDWRGFFVTPAASFLRMPSWRPRGSRHSRGSDCDLRGAKRLSPISTAASYGRCVDLEDAADNIAVGQHVEIIFVPVAGAPARRCALEDEGVLLNRSVRSGSSLVATDQRPDLMIVNDALRGKRVMYKRLATGVFRDVGNSYRRSR